MGYVIEHGQLTNPRRGVRTPDGRVKRGRTINLGAVSVARTTLDTLVREHPELRGPRDPDNEARWLTTLRKIEEDAMSTETTQCAFRLQNDLVKRLDAYAERMTDAQPGMTFTRADAVRMLLTRALDDEPKAKSGRPRKR